MGNDGQGKDGFARPGCHCKACDVTNSQMEEMGYGSQAGYQEQFSIGSPSRDYRNWELDFARHLEQMAGVPLDQQT